MDYSSYLETGDNLDTELRAWRTARLFARHAQVISDYLPRLKEPARILEIGMGPGFVAKQVFRNDGERIGEYVGVDKCKREVKMAADGLADPRWTCYEQDVRDVKPSGVAQWFGGALPDVVAAFAFVKHFSCEEWPSVVRTLLDVSRRFTIFEINLSATGGPIDDGPADPNPLAKSGAKLFPHSYAEPMALKILIDMSGFDVIEHTRLSGTIHGWETLFVCERRNA